jgi:predicted ATPase
MAGVDPKAPFRSISHRIARASREGQSEQSADGGEGARSLASGSEHVKLEHSVKTGQLYYDAELQRLRGELLIRQNPADPAPAEAAFLTAIAVAQQQKARSLELLAALSLARLYQSIGRAIDAHDVRGPAPAGFSPTPEFPAIAEANALFEATGAQL